MDVYAVVLSCGWVGILISDMHANKGLDVVYIEKELALGRLLSTEVIDGFVVDVDGTYIIYSKDSKLLYGMLTMLGDNVTSNERSSYITPGGTLTSGFSFY